jgi:signal transduction histidine kinase
MAAGVLYTSGRSAQDPESIARAGGDLSQVGGGKRGAHYRVRPTLKVATRNVGEAVEIRIRDNGIGIPPDIRDKLFQPFFTTKPTGEGTGLGLSISYDIVTQQHGGTIEVESEVGEFTEFTVRLPRVYKSVAEAAS